MKKFEQFAKEIGFNQQVLDNYVTFADAHYNTFYITKKKKSKKRKIDYPSKELKAIQRWILANYLNSLPVSARANGFIQGRGIKRNAQYHLKKSFLLIVDVKDFFPSISQKKIYQSLQKYFKDKEFSLKLSKVCTFKRFLPQGAPTSPMLSNIVFKDLDDKIAKYCNSKLVVYSRYADDLVFSCDTRSTLTDIYLYVRTILTQNDFKINESKTKFLSGRGRIVITGININEGKLTVRKEIKRNLRSNIYNLIIKKDKTIKINSVLGYLSFIKDIEPEYYTKIVAYIKRLKGTSAM
ncbi:MAG: RNA-directed DNA polymerase [Chitinophagaceae bacterium]|nr:RNA-directed DNA polymerase [Chitinophagaceae bacterium]